MIKVNNLRIYQSMIEHELGVRETCVLSRVNHQTLKKMLTGLMVRIPVHELLIVSRDDPPFDKLAGNKTVSHPVSF